MPTGILYALELNCEAEKVSDAHRVTISNLDNAAGGVVAVAYGLDEALGKLAEWGKLR